MLAVLIWGNGVPRHYTTPYMGGPYFLFLLLASLCFVWFLKTESIWTLAVAGLIVGFGALCRLRESGAALFAFIIILL